MSLQPQTTKGYKSISKTSINNTDKNHKGKKACRRRVPTSYAAVRCVAERLRRRQ